ncbi:hypothetical protein FB451DRAFT_1392737 [Mycena latifolia]|nr:hypothetical protein FB451DRAFT_1392737 [Mycena latifolia]
MMVDLAHPQLDFGSPFFQTVSHLIVGELDCTTTLGDPLGSDWRHWPAIFRLPTLTHLGLAHPIPPSLLHFILSTLPHLSTLLILAKNERAAMEFAQQLVLHDGRMVILGLEGFEGFNLLEGTRTVDVLWTWADAFVACPGSHPSFSVQILPPAVENRHLPQIPTRLTMDSHCTIQIPQLINTSLDRGQGWMVGDGKNLWPSVETHEQVADPRADLYVQLADSIQANPGTGHGREGLYSGASDEHCLIDVHAWSSRRSPPRRLPGAS